MLKIQISDIGHLVIGISLKLELEFRIRNMI